MNEGEKYEINKFRRGHVSARKFTICVVVVCALYEQSADVKPCYAIGIAVMPDEEFNECDKVLGNEYSYVTEDIMVVSMVEMTVQLLSVQTCGEMYAHIHEQKTD